MLEAELLLKALIEQQKGLAYDWGRAVIKYIEHKMHQSVELKEKTCYNPNWIIVWKMKPCAEILLGLVSDKILIRG